MSSEPLTEEERRTLKAAAFGAVFLVANADPGVLDMIRESFAASGVFADSSGLVKDVLTSGPLPELPDRYVERTAEVVLPELRRSIRILLAKAPEEEPAFRAMVSTAVNEVAAAVGGVSVAEAAMLARVRTALGVPG